MSTEEGNKLIAHFMGNEVDGNRMLVYPRWLIMQYHTSWDWLMPVVEKIENGCGNPYSVEIDKYSCGVRYVHIFNGKKVQFFEAADSSKIETVWKTVVAFIQWYNENKPLTP